MKHTVFLELPWPGEKEEPWSAQTASPRPSALQQDEFNLLGRKGQTQVGRS